MLFHQLDRYRDIGLLILRIGIGTLFVWHGSVKLSGGPENWKGLGEALNAMGVDFAPTFMGLVASLSEFGGGLLLILGLLTRPRPSSCSAPWSSEVDPIHWTKNGYC